LEQLHELLPSIILHGEEREDNVDYNIKRASMLSEDEMTALGLIGIPSDWPIEQYIYIDSTPDGFEKISAEDLIVLKANNQSAYDSWSALKQTGIPLMENYKIEVYNSNAVIQETKWFQDKNSDGSYSNLAKLISYSYVTGTNSVKQIDSIKYNSVSGITFHEVTRFYTDKDTNQVFTETEVL